jgi:acetyl esterase/lipase
VTGWPVRLVLTRAQMFTLSGHQPATRQDVRLGATTTGRLTAHSHYSVNSRLLGPLPMLIYFHGGGFRMRRQVLRYEGMRHGFFQMDGVLKEARDVRRDIARWLRHELQVAESVDR